jgi:phosphoribosylglycinamide formyltransferase 1
MAERVRVGVLISGRGTNLVALSEYKRREPRAYDLALVVSNVPEARGLVAARRLGIPTWSLSHKGMAREEFDRLVDAELRRHGVEVVALAG